MNLLQTITQEIENSGGYAECLSLINREWGFKQKSAVWARDFESEYVLLKWMEGKSAKNIAKYLGRSTQFVYTVLNKFRNADNMHRTGNGKGVWTKI